MARQRDRIRRARSAFILEFVSLEWQSCTQIMARAGPASGWSWQAVCRYLKNLVASGEIELAERIEVAARGRVRHVRIYKRAERLHFGDEAPSWFLDAAGFSRK